MSRDLLKVIQENTKPVSKEDFDKFVAKNHGGSRENASSDITALDSIRLEVFGEVLQRSLVELKDEKDIARVEAALKEVNIELKKREQRKGLDQMLSSSTEMGLYDNELDGIPDNHKK
jgi:hypothetical protein